MPPRTNLKDGVNGRLKKTEHVIRRTSGFGDIASSCNGYVTSGPPRPLHVLVHVRPNNTFGFLVPEATFCREDAQNPVSGTRFCHLSRDRHTPEPPRYRAFCGFLGPDTCISGSFTAPSCLSARSCPVPDGGGCSRRVWVGPWSLWQVQKCYSVSARWPVCIIVAICWAPGSTDGHDCASCV